ncbi:MAG: cobalamin-dependent protein [Candidatus Thiodiazotropha taylori]|nr:cobalamin-dependent protein [Candidatus Thiodiazotropha taylori]MCG7918833.1 cobalamin-dependent protein [Candidatus Thiodiazotropha taylori]MCG7924210.1 cobalamin-dependent protein [Candidatus Thiodiazotropha taylori]MCG7934564.1 cobalamin-dependent protein [Candidatus Thiodiazotropha taylori]MCG8072286.1 cobalamin-dependent protein [Candidatus Thiodiazotropha taylori]
MKSLQDLIIRARQIDKIPPSSVNAYLDKKEQLLDQVNRAIAAHPEFGSFLGENSFELLENNHRNHVSFMAEIFAQNDFESLARALPWVYRAYHNQGVDYAYFPAELNAWSTAIRQLINPDYAKPLIQVYEWVLAQHELTIAIAESETQLNVSVEARFKPNQQEFMGALKARDMKQCLSISQQALKLGASLQDIFNHVIYPSMVEVGLQWESGEISVAEEHQATSIVNSVISALYLEADFPMKQTATAVVSAAPSERHEMGAWMTAACLELDGWKVTYLGSDIPAEEVAMTTIKVRADLLALSIAMPFNIPSAREVIRAVRADPLGRNIKVMVGGQVFLQFPGLVSSLDADACLSNCLEAVDWANKLIGRSDS